MYQTYMYIKHLCTKHVLYKHTPRKHVMFATHLWCPGRTYLVLPGHHTHVMWCPRHTFYTLPLSHGCCHYRPAGGSHQSRYTCPKDSAA